MPAADRLRSALAAAAAGTWLGRGAWTFLDQALFAGSNFLVSVLLARWLPPEDYGAFAVAQTLFLLLGTLHGGYVVEPMLVYGSGRFEPRMERYLRVLLGGHGAFSLAVGGLLGAGALVAWAWGQPVLAAALAAFAAGQSAILFQWMMRAACYLRTQPAVAASTGAIYAALMLAGVAALRGMGVLSVASAVLLMSAASLLAGALIAWRLHVPAAAEADGPFASEVGVRHRQYGSWAAGTGVLEWFHGYLPFLLLPVLGGLGEAGALRALGNFVLPVIHVFRAFGNLMLPVFVRARERGAEGRILHAVASGALAFSALFSVAVVVVGPALMHALYEGKYDAYAGGLWLIAAMPLALAVSNVAQAFLRSGERPEAVFAARAAASGVAATLGAAAVAVLGVVGALLSDVLSTATEAAVMLGLIRGPAARRAGSVSDDAHGAEPARRHVLVVAFSCAPGRGSEPGQGWQTATRLAATADVTALVYAGYRPEIERELAARPVPGLRVVYAAVAGEPAAYREGRRVRTGVREQLHYLAWNLSAGKAALAVHDARPVDLVHHASFMRYWSPSAGAVVASLGVPMVWGPVGGGESAPAAFVRSMPPRGRARAWLRDAVRAASHAMPAVQRTARAATVALATTDASARRMRAIGAADVRVPPAVVALDDAEARALGALPPPPPGPFRVLSLGRLLDWKGVDTGLRAFAEAVGAGGPPWAGAHYDVVGEGPDRPLLERLARALGVADRVTFHGAVPRADALAHLARAHVLLFPSLHDSGGYAVLEALAAGRPVLCLALGGPGRIVTPDVGVAVEAACARAAVADLAAALARFASDPGLGARTGAAARRRVAERYLWSDLAAALARVHDEALGAPAPARAGRLAAVPA